MIRSGDLIAYLRAGTEVECEGIIAPDVRALSRKLLNLGFISNTPLAVRRRVKSREDEVARDDLMGFCFGEVPEELCKE